MAKVNLAVTSRTETGTQAAKKARRAGFIPAIVYGHGMKPLSLRVGLKAFR